jgi:hypothetical protein
MYIIDNVFALMFCSLKFFGDFGTNHMGGKLIFVGCDGGSIFNREGTGWCNDTHEREGCHCVLDSALFPRRTDMAILV